MAAIMYDLLLALNPTAHVDSSCQRSEMLACVRPWRNRVPFSSAKLASVRLTIESSDRHRSETLSVYHRSEEHTSELQSLAYLVCRLLLEKKKKAESATS